MLPKQGNIYGVRSNTDVVYLYISVILAALVVIITFAPSVAFAQKVGSGNTLVAVSDSDGSTKNIDSLIQEAKDSGAEIQLVKPDDGEKIPSSGSRTDQSKGSGDPSTDSGEIKRDVDGDLLKDQALKGVQLMEPKVESALKSVPNDHKVFVVAEGYGAGAAGNVLEKMAFDEGPIDKTRILGHVLIGDPYRTGSSSSQSQDREEFTLEGLEGEDTGSRSDNTGFMEPASSEKDLPEGYENETDKEISDALSQGSGNSDVDRVGENNDGTDNNTDDPYGNMSGDQGQGTTDNGRVIVPDRIENYGEKPEANPNNKPVKPKKDSDSSSGSPSSSGSSGDIIGQNGESLGSADSSGGSSGSSEDPNSAAPEDQFVPDDFKPGDGKDGADVQENRPENPEANHGEGAMGDGDIWAKENGRQSTEREVTSSDSVSTASRVSTPGTGVLGQRSRGFGDMEDSTLSICSANDDRCASNGLSYTLVQVMTGDLQKAPELAQKSIRGLIALGKLLASIDYQNAIKFGVEAAKCGVSVSAVSASGAAGAASIAGGTTAGISIPAAMSLLVASGGATKTCAKATAMGLEMSADIYRLYRKNPDLVQATEIIALIDPDSQSFNLIKSKLPVEFQNKDMEDVLRKFAKVGYALDSIRGDRYMEMYANGANKISNLNPVGVANLLTASLSLSDAVTKAVFEKDQTIFGEIGSALAGVTGEGSMANTFGEMTGRSLTQAGSRYDSEAFGDSGHSDSSGYGDSYGQSNSDSYSGGTSDSYSGNSMSNRRSRSTSAFDNDYSQMNVADNLNALQFAGEFLSKTMGA